MRFLRGHLAIYIERNNRPLRKEFYISRKGGLKICICRLVIWIKHLKYV